MIEEFNKLYKHIKSSEGKSDMDKFKKMLRSRNKYLNKLDTYFTDTMDGVKPEVSAKENKLL